MKYDVPKSLQDYHTKFPGGIRWRLTAEGLEIETEELRRTGGRPQPIRRLWVQYFDPINSSSERSKVPVELIVPLIAITSHGDVRAQKPMPGFVSDQKTPELARYGLTLIDLATATRFAQSTGLLQLPGFEGLVNRDWLFKPANAIAVTAAYLASQKGQTGFDPPLVAAAYNSGFLKAAKDHSSHDNRWKLYQTVDEGECFCDRYVLCLNDLWAILGNDPFRPKGLSFYQYFHEDIAGSAAPHPQPATEKEPAPSNVYKYPVDVDDLVNRAKKGGDDFVRVLALKDGMREDEKLRSVLWNISDGRFPVTLKKKWHPAVDIGVPTPQFGDYRGSPVYAVADGEVILTQEGFASDENFDLSRLILRHKAPDRDELDEFLEFFLQYRHVQRICVTSNQRVKAGEKVAEVGWHGSFPHVEVSAASLDSIGGKELEPELSDQDLHLGDGVWSALRVKVRALDKKDWPMVGVAEQPGYLYDPIQLVRFCLKQPYRQFIGLGVPYQFAPVPPGTLTPLSPDQSTVKIDYVLRSEALGSVETLQKMAQDRSFTPIEKGHSDPEVVMAIQKALVQCHYLIGRHGLGNLGMDGHFSDATERTVMDFQERHVKWLLDSAGTAGVLGKTTSDLKANGKVDWFTLMALDACAPVANKVPALMPDQAGEDQNPPPPDHPKDPPYTGKYSCTFDASQTGLENLSIHFGMRLYKVLRRWTWRTEEVEDGRTVWKPAEFELAKYQADPVNYKAKGVGYSCVPPLPYKGIPPPAQPPNNKPYPHDYFMACPSDYPEPLRAKKPNGTDIKDLSGRWYKHVVWGGFEFTGCGHSNCCHSQLAAFTCALMPEGKTDTHFWVKGGSEFRRSRESLIDAYDMLAPKKNMTHPEVTGMNGDHKVKIPAEKAFYQCMIAFGPGDAPRYWKQPPPNPNTPPQYTVEVTTLHRNGKPYAHMANAVAEMGLGEPLFPTLKTIENQFEAKRLRLGDLVNSGSHAWMIGDIRYGIWLEPDPAAPGAPATVPYVPDDLLDQSSFVGANSKGKFWRAPKRHSSDDHSSYLGRVIAERGLGPWDPDEGDYRRTIDLIPPLSDEDCDWLIDPEGGRKNERAFMERVQAFLDMHPMDGRKAGTVTIDGHERTVKKIEVVAYRVFSANTSHPERCKHGLVYKIGPWTLDLPTTKSSFRQNGITAEWKHVLDPHKDKICASRFYPPAY